MKFLKKYYLVYFLLFAFFVGGAIAVSRMEKPVLPTAAQQGQHIRTVVIDPGHGGEDGGAVSVTGSREGELNLQISLRVNDLLHLLGIQTVMTRSEDVSIHDSAAQTISEKKVSDLKNRAALANGTENALFLSIHQNMFPEAKYRGAQVFFAKTEGSDALAQLLQTMLREQADPSNHREAKLCSAVWLMEHIECTAVLVECGFLSNAEEEQWLKTPEYQKKLSCVLACGITEYLSEEIEQNEI